MSFDATRWAWKVKVQNSSEKLVLVNLADRVNAYDECWPSQKRISADTQLNIKTVRKALKSLMSQNILSDTKKRKRQVIILKLNRSDDLKPLDTINVDVDLPADSTFFNLHGISKKQVKFYKDISLDSVPYGSCIALIKRFIDNANVGKRVLTQKSFDKSMRELSKMMISKNPDAILKNAINQNYHWLKDFENSNEGIEIEGSFLDKHTDRAWTDGL